MDKLPNPYYQDDWCTIYNNDCRSILPLLEKVDLVLTDPPYGINRSGQQSTVCKKSKHNRKLYQDYKWDQSAPDKSLFDLIKTKSKNQVYWGANYYPYALDASMGWLFWDKGQDFSTSDGELAYTSFQNALRRIVVNRGQIAVDGAIHPTQKPLKVITFCIEYADKNGGYCKTILDPFMGSGTTLRAAKDLNRKAIGIEIEEKYCEIAAQRCMQEVIQF